MVKENSEFMPHEFKFITTVQELEKLKFKLTFDGVLYVKRFFLLFVNAYLEDDPDFMEFFYKFLKKKGMLKPSVANRLMANKKKEREMLNDYYMTDDEVKHFYDILEYDEQWQDELEKEFDRLEEEPDDD